LVSTILSLNINKNSSTFGGWGIRILTKFECCSGFHVFGFVEWVRKLGVVEQDLDPEAEGEWIPSKG
jgi:hypothetical protein